jgi:hypothetical protein
MRIINDDADVICNSMMEPTYYHKADTVDISDKEWEDIYCGFDEWETDNLYEDFEPTFALYLRELIKLARAK